MDRYTNIYIACSNGRGVRRGRNMSEDRRRNYEGLQEEECGERRRKKG